MEKLMGTVLLMLDGTQITLQIFCVTLVMALPLGLLAALARISKLRPLSLLMEIYIWIMRGTPLMLQLLFVYFALPMIGIRLPDIAAALLAFTLNYAAYFAEIYRSGIQSIPRGQVYAGQALGMTYSQNMKLVVLPQAFRNMLPVLLTQTIILFQDTSLVYAIGAYDMLKGFEVAGKNFGRPIEAYLAAAVLYFVMCYALSWSVKRLHKKIAIIR